jgi:hypothetical protein
MTANLDGVRIKLQRADMHIAELRELITPIASSATMSITREVDADNPSRLIYCVGDVPDIEPMAAAVMGDIVHNLRSALDHLAWQLVILDGQQPDDNTSFPLHLSPTNTKGNPRVLTIKPGIKDAAIMAAVEQLQPYTSAKYGHHPSTDALGIIAQLDNIDKHRLLLTVMHSINFDEPGWWTSDHDDAPTFTFNLEPLSSGDVVATFDFGERTPPADFDPHISLAVSIGDLASVWMRGRDVVDSMAGLRNLVATEINIHFVQLMNEQFVAIVQ